MEKIIGYKYSLHSKSKKSTGFDNIDSYIVKQIAQQIVNQLANIFNKSFLTNKLCVGSG